MAPTPPNQAHLDTDLIIAGGGLAGATLALAMARLVPEVRVTVVESVPLAADALTDDYQPSYDARSTALAWGSRQIFEGLGLWPVLAEHATPIRHIHVSDRGRFGATRLHASEHQQEALGYVADNRWMGLSLMAALADTRVRWLAPAEVIHMVPLGDGVQVRVRCNDQHEMLTAQCLVVADGGRSGLRETLGFRVETRDYGQNALIANVSTADAHLFTAYERFTDSGPMAMLPQGSPTRASHESALVWTLDDPSLEALLALPDDQKCHRLQARFGWRLGQFTRIGSCHYYPLTLTTVEAPVRPGVALVGNAAHTLHPVAGQGFNLALRGLMTLVAQFRRAVDTGQALGDLAILTAYQDQHRHDRSRTVQFSDSLIRVFGERNRPLAAARDAGLVGLDVLPLAKRWFARQAMGTGGRVPVFDHAGPGPRPAGEPSGHG